eukprot:SAG25_NODE_5944_length_603_cov_1.501984_1_plen_73_part_10
MARCDSDRLHARPADSARAAATASPPPPALSGWRRWRLGEEGGPAPLPLSLRGGGGVEKRPACRPRSGGPCHW